MHIGAVINKKFHYFLVAQSIVKRGSFNILPLVLG